MKVFVALSCILAVTTASWIPNVWWQGQHLPVIGPNGVPLEPPANVAARAQHAAAVAEAQARNGDLALIVPGLSGLLAANVIGPNGVPLEPAANIAARAQHAAAVAEAQARNGDISGLALLGGIPLANGVPVEPLANQIARAQHAAAVAHAHGRKRRSILLNGIGPNGVPIEPLENQIARAQHAAAVAAAQSGVILTPGLGLIPGLGWAPAGLTRPAIAADGQPIKTPEVQVLEAQHAQAHAEARARNLAGGIVVPGWGGWAGVPLIANGVPVDTPEVAAARAAHLAAKAAAVHGAWA